jgi:hypothetical protein
MHTFILKFIKSIKSIKRGRPVHIYIDGKNTFVYVRAIMVKDR